LLVAELGLQQEPSPLRSKSISGSRRGTGATRRWRELNRGPLPGRRRHLRLSRLRHRVFQPPPKVPSRRSIHAAVLRNDSPPAFDEAVHIGKGEQFAQDFLRSARTTRFRRSWIRGPGRQAICAVRIRRDHEVSGREVGLPATRAAATKRGLGPMLGQALHFGEYAKEKLPYVIFDRRYGGVSMAAVAQVSRSKTRRLSFGILAAPTAISPCT
jgi:hypothetical protein